MGNPLHFLPISFKIESYELEKNEKKSFLRR